MTRKSHFHCISRLPREAQVDIVSTSPLSVLLEGIFLIMDRILLTQSQLPWKVFFPGNATSNGTTGDTGTDGGTGIGVGTDTGF